MTGPKTGGRSPLCDSPWPSPEHLREHLRTKLSKSEEARQIQNSLLRNGNAIAGEIIRVTALMAAVLKLAKGQDDKAFVQLLNSWKTDLDALKAKLATVDGITGLKIRLEGGWVEMPEMLTTKLATLMETLNAKPDQSATLEAQTFLTTAQIRLGDYREGMRNNKAAEIAKACSKTAY